MLFSLLNLVLVVLYLSLFITLACVHVSVDQETKVPVCPFQRHSSSPGTVFFVVVASL